MSDEKKKLSAGLERLEALTPELPRPEKSHHLVVFPLETGPSVSVDIGVIPDGVLIVRQDLKIIAINQRIVELLGYVRNELVGQPVEMLVPEDKRESCGRGIKSFFEHPYRRFGELAVDGLAKSGGLVPLRITLGYMEVSYGFLAIAFIREGARSDGSQ